MNSSVNTPYVQLSFFSESLSAIICSAGDRKRSAAAEGMEQLIRDRGFRKGEGYEYVNTTIKVSLICPSGHQFEADPKSFKRGFGCPKCSKCCPMQAQEDLKRLIAERGFREDLDFIYVNNTTRVPLICPSNHHFRQTPKIFKKGYGCPKCSGTCPEQAREDFDRLISEQGFRKGSEYNYINSISKTLLICPNGHCVEMRPSDFKSGYGCLKCSGRCPDQAQENFEQLIAERGFRKGENFVYVNYKTRVPLICPSGHQFKVNPSSFKHGRGCPGCSVRASGFNQCVPATLYYVVFYPWPSRAVYKIGVTNRTAADRYKYCKTPHRILMEKHFESGQDCFNEEVTLIRKHKKHRCKDAPVDGIGSKELFDIDILGLDVAL
jgi:hypothetical protein